MYRRRLQRPHSPKPPLSAEASGCLLCFPGFPLPPREGLTGFRDRSPFPASASSKRRFPDGTSPRARSRHVHRFAGDSAAHDRHPGRGSGDPAQDHSRASSHPPRSGPPDLRWKEDYLLDTTVSPEAKSFVRPSSGPSHTHWKSRVSRPPPARSGLRSVAYGRCRLYGNRGRSLPLRCAAHPSAPLGTARRSHRGLGIAAQAALRSAIPHPPPRFPHRPQARRRGGREASQKRDKAVLRNRSWRYNQKLCLS
jgi:hypothetical protein